MPIVTIAGKPFFALVAIFTIPFRVDSIAGGGTLLADGIDGLAGKFGGSSRVRPYVAFGQRRDVQTVFVSPLRQARVA